MTGRVKSLEELACFLGALFVSVVSKLFCVGSMCPLHHVGSRVVSLIIRQLRPPRGSILRQQGKRQIVLYDPVLEVTQHYFYPNFII